MSELKPCPFCGSEPRIREFMQFGKTEWIVECKNLRVCECRTPWRKSKELAITQWNTRQPDPEIISIITGDRIQSYIEIIIPKFSKFCRYVLGFKIAEMLNNDIKNHVKGK